MIPPRLRPVAVFVAFTCWGYASAYAQQQDPAQDRSSEDQEVRPYEEVILRDGIESALGGGLDTPTRYHLEDALVRIDRILDPSP